MSRLSTLARARMHLGHVGTGSLCNFHLQTPKSDWFCIGRRCYRCYMDTHYASATELNQSIEGLSDE